MNFNIKSIVFDLGGVLIDWNPNYVYEKVFNGDQNKMNWFYDNICTFDWNENQDSEQDEDELTLARSGASWLRLDTDQPFLPPLRHFLTRRAGTSGGRE